MIFNLIKRAKELFYNNSKSGLEATDVQGAIDEVNNKLTYSTDEQEIGVWVDGKPIYRRVTNFGACNKDTLTVIDNLTIKNLISISGYAKESDNTYKPITNKGFLLEYFNSSKSMCLTPSITLLSGYVILEYTKD